MSYLHSLLPRDPEVAPCEEAGDGVPGQVVDPALLPQLGHDGVDPREARPAVGPLGQRLGVLVPRDLNRPTVKRLRSLIWNLVYLDTDGVAVHAVKVGILGGRRVEEVPPEELAEQRQRRFVLLDL